MAVNCRTEKYQALSIAKRETSMEIFFPPHIVQFAVILTGKKG
jgi:hypothetical protein